ncbi:MAG: GNAT family N-acetyltransferase [Actinomycetota bacterium]
MTGSSPWDLAERAAKEAGVSLRLLTTLEDADAALGVMVDTWGDEQLLPRELVRAFQASGNVPIGAFEDDTLVGYVLGFLGPGDDAVHLHSHMLAVEPKRRSAGVGYALKLAQRAWALDTGVDVVRWTFDPLVARNAYFNLSKLGAVADRFHREFYGQMTDALNRGDRSDRLEARWDLSREPGPRRPSGDAVTVKIPAGHAGLKERDPSEAKRVRDEVAAELEARFAEGFIATGFLKQGAYVFESGAHP